MLRHSPLLLLCSAGAKKREEIYQAFEQIYPVLKEFKKGGMIEVRAGRREGRGVAVPSASLSVGLGGNCIGNAYCCLSLCSSCGV